MSDFLLLMTGLVVGAVAGYGLAAVMSAAARQDAEREAAYWRAKAEKFQEGARAAAKRAYGDY